ncbi:MAG: hypothetical protein VXY42_00035 [Candidatus Thermoplasmatota archaeon]|nr:hypothetical protein [Candidatus Thermoplasmatota archaeon]
MHFRWRTNPTVVAQYMNDADVPRQAEVTLKPNEVCVVLENGKIVGSVSQQHLEVNPQIGLFSKLFGKTNPVRSFMFAFTGPHSILVQVRGISDNGDEINCLVTLKVEITRETATRLITFPAKGTMMVQRKDIAEILSPGVNSTVLQHLRGLNADSMRTVQANDDVMYAVKAALRGTLDEHGLTYRGGFITWSSTAAEQQMQQQHDLERLQLARNKESEQQAIELDHFVKNEQRKHEVNARMALVGVQAKEAAEMKLELERLKASGEFNLQQWRQQQEIDDQKAESARTKAIKDAEANVEIAKLEAERQKTLASVEKDAENDKMTRAMEMFEQVQARKRDRMQMKNEQEQQRLEQHTKASQSTIDVLEKIAANSDDPMVQMEALKQLAELRKADVVGQKDAYKNDD